MLTIADPSAGTPPEILDRIFDPFFTTKEIGKATLETHSYQAITANDGIEAIALYAEHKQKIGVVLLDLMMPLLDAATIIRTLYISKL
jgi:CheY-like chemotaxis protein